MHSYNNLLTTPISYGLHTDVLMESYRRDDATQVVVHSCQNLGRAESLSASTTLSRSFLGGKWTNDNTLAWSMPPSAAPLRASTPPGGRTTWLPTTPCSCPYGLKAEASVNNMAPMTFGGVAFHARFSSSFRVSELLFK